MRAHTSSASANKPTANTNNHAHYLIQRTVEALDYSDNLGEPVWASWDLTAADVGSATRTTSYYVDTNLPPNFPAKSSPSNMM